MAQPHLLPSGALQRSGGRNARAPRRKTRQFLREGLPRKEAEQAARRAFGNPTLIEQRGREVWQCPLLEALWADAKYAWRQLGRSPGFALTAILTLALGIGANTAVFGVLNSVLLKPLSFSQPDRLVRIFSVKNGTPIGQPDCPDLSASRGDSAALTSGRHLRPPSRMALRIDSSP